MTYENEVEAMSESERRAQVEEEQEADWCAEFEQMADDDFGAEVSRMVHDIDQANRGFESMSDEAWRRMQVLIMVMEHHAMEGRRLSATRAASARAGKLRGERQAAAEASFASDESLEDMEEADGWEFVEPGREWVRAVYFQCEKGGSERRTYVVRFKSFVSAEVEEAYVSGW